MLVEKLHWDSEFFNNGIANLDLKTNSLLSTNKLINFVKQNNIKFIQCLCDIKDIKNINLIEKSGFSFYDLRISFSVNIQKTLPKSISKDFIIREAVSSDKIKIQEISSTLVNDSRFLYYADEIKVKEFYNVWVENAINKTFDNICYIIAEKRNNEISGFVTLKYVSKTIYQVGLIAVKEKFQNQSIGSFLLNYLYSKCNLEKIEELNVVTEGRNLAAINFYIKNSFKINKIESWYYKSY